MKRHAERQNGFTMIEMVLVLIVMAIVTSFIVFRGSTGDNELIAEAEILKSHLRYAQTRAMSDESPWGIHLENAGSYVLYKNNAPAPPQNILPGETAQTHTLPAAVTITAGVGTTINFDGWGSPGTTTLAISLTQGTQTSSITITKKTGHIP